MENAIAFSYTLIGLELVEIKGVKDGSFLTPSLKNLLHRVQYYEANSHFYGHTFKFHGEYRGEHTLP